jgi:hypothetical protein
MYLGQDASMDGHDCRRFRAYDEAHGRVARTVNELAMVLNVLVVSLLHGA